MKNKNLQTGFTLVELAIVLVIIGLIIAGILKAQEVVSNSQVTSTITDMEDYAGVVNTFTLTYGVLAGDMSNAEFRLDGCDADPCNNGDGDGEINVRLGDVNTISDEGGYFFNQLRAAGLISNISGEAVAAFGEAFPSAPVGGGYMVGDTRTGVNEFDDTVMREGVYIIVVRALENVDVDTGILTPSEAARIDRVLDDGDPSTGRVHGQTTDGACVNTGGDDEYDEIDSHQQVCVIAYQIRG